MSIAEFRISPIMSSQVPTCRFRVGLALKASIAFCMIATSVFIIRVADRPSSQTVTEEEYNQDDNTEQPIETNLLVRNPGRHVVGGVELDDVIFGFQEERRKKSVVVRNSQTNRLTSSVLPNQHHRLRRMKDVCYNHLASTAGAAQNKTAQPEVDEVFPEPDWKEMYVDDRRRYIYCLVSKVACTSWKRTLLMMTGLIQSTTKYKTMADLPVGFVHNYAYSDRYLRRMIHFENKAEAKYRLYNYYKFMFVRDPMERLVSAYRDKILTDPSYHVNEQIVRMYRYAGNKNKTDHAIWQSRENATFSEFVQYVLDQRASGKQLDRHWAPQSELCSPCRVRYDFIGHYETLHEDASAVVDELKMRPIPPLGYGDNSSTDGNNFRFPGDDIHSHGSPGPPGRTKSGKLVELMLAKLDDYKLRKIVEVYSDDYDLFGYKRPLRATSNDIVISSEKSTTNVDKEDRDVTAKYQPGNERVPANKRNPIKYPEKKRKLKLTTLPAFNGQFRS